MARLPPVSFAIDSSRAARSRVKTEHGEVELDDDAALEWARQDSIKMATERQRAALRRFEQRRQGRDEGGVVIIDDSDDDDDAPPPPPAEEGPAGAPESRRRRPTMRRRRRLLAFSKFF